MEDQKSYSLGVAMAILNNQEKKNWDKSLCSGLRVDLYDCDDESPAIILEPFLKGVDYEWIPQSLYDQIWVLCFWETVEEKTVWEGKLTGLAAKWLSPELIPFCFKYL